MDVMPVCEGILATLRKNFGLETMATHLPYSAIEPETGLVNLPSGKSVFDEIVFAEGVAIMQNPWFPAVQLWPLKGQVAEMKFGHGLPEGMILKYDMFLIPKGNNFYTVGSTYEREFFDANPSAEGIETITNAVRQHIAPLMTASLCSGGTPTFPSSLFSMAWVQKASCRPHISPRFCGNGSMENHLRYRRMWN
jgi:hypothetical protein